MQKNNIKLTRKQILLQWIKFIIFSLSAGGLQFISFAIMHDFFYWGYIPSYPIALIISYVYNVTLNREFTFKSATNLPVAIVKVTFYYIIFAPLSSWWGWKLENILNPYVILLGTMLVNFVTEFLFYNFFIFSGSVNTNKRGLAEQQKLDEKGKTT